MKAKQYTIAMLIALIFASASIQAQSARRPTAKEKKEQSRITSTHKRQSSSTKARSTEPARKAESKQVRSSQARSPQNARTTKSANYRKPANTNSGQQMRKASGTKNHVQKVNRQTYKPVSMTTSKNPRSTYRKSNKTTYSETRYTTPVKSKVHYKRGYYGGHHYHYAYPTRKVKIHYHHNTYVNRYHVLYYPTYGDIYWTRSMYRDYHRWYPGFHWSYNYGHRIHSISIWDAKYNLGEVAMVYGRVYATWYNNETDDYLLFFGGDFPNQQFTAVVPGHVARKFSWRPHRYFLGEHMTITGLITTFDGSPEIVIKNRRQLSLY